MMELNARQCVEQEENNNTEVTENKQLQQYNNKCRGRNRLKKAITIIERLNVMSYGR
jgi:hypothetical protein